MNDAKKIEALILKSDILCDSCGEYTSSYCAEYLGKYLAENGARVDDIPKKMPTVYICSPYRGDTNRNIIYARRLVKWALENGFSPICPHLYLPQILDDSNPEERALGLCVGLELMRGCDALAVGASYGISDGMQMEIERAKELGINIFIPIIKRRQE